MNAFCEHKLRSLSEVELRTLAEVSEESIAQILGGPCSNAEVDAVALGESGWKNQADEGRMQLISTPVKIPRSANCDVTASMVFFMRVTK